MPFAHFPWFQEVAIGQLLKVESPQPHHLYWPELDVDIAVESIEHPDRYPLVSKVRSNNAAQRLGRFTARRRSRA